MNFEDLQKEFEELTLDASATWISWWTLNKKCINKSYEYLFDILKNSQKIKNYLWLVKTKITFTDNIANLPDDFDTIDKVFTCNFSSNSDIYSWFDYSTSNRYFDFIVSWTIWSKKMTIQEGYTELWITYIPKLVLLSEGTDIPILPNEIQRLIPDFAIFEYNRRIRDDISASNSLQLAQNMLSQKMKTLN